MALRIQPPAMRFPVLTDRVPVLVRRMHFFCAQVSRLRAPRCRFRLLLLDEDIQPTRPHAREPDYEARFGAKNPQAASRAIAHSVRWRPCRPFCHIEQQCKQYAFAREWANSAMRYKTTPYARWVRKKSVNLSKGITLTLSYKSVWTAPGIIISSFGSAALA